MIVLGIETSGETGSVALCTERETLAGYAFEEGARHARDIVPAIDRIFARAGVGKADVEAVAVSQGPGSFTGLRVGITCAKALAYALGWQAVGVPSLEVLAQNVEPAAGGAEYACPVLDARRARVYGTVFRWDGAAWADTTGVMLKEPAELAAAVPDGALVFGTGVRAYPKAFATGRLVQGDRALERGRAEAVARLGLERIRAGLAVDPLELLPQYYRVTEAEERLDTSS